MRKFFVALAAFTAATTGLGLAGTYFVGTKADIAAVQALEHRIAPTHNNILGVHVIGNYALLLFWSGTSFSPDLYKHDAFKRISDERWTRIYTGTGVDACSQLVQHGVPASSAHNLCSNWGDVGS